MQLHSKKRRRLHLQPITYFYRLCNVMFLFAYLFSFKRHVNYKTHSASWKHITYQLTQRYMNTCKCRHNVIVCYVSTSRLDIYVHRNTKTSTFGSTQ